MWREKQASRLHIQSQQKDLLDQLQEDQSMMDNAIRDGKTANSYTIKILQLLNDMKVQPVEYKDQLVEQSHCRVSAKTQMLEKRAIRDKLEHMIMVCIRTQIKREKPIGCKGGATH